MEHLRNTRLIVQSRRKNTMRGIIALSVFAILSITLAEAIPCLPLYSKTPFYRYYKPGGHSDHFYTTNANEIGTTTKGQKGNHGYTSEGVQCYIYRTKVHGSVPLYRYWKGGVSDHFYTTNVNEIGTSTKNQVGRYGYVSEGIAGYCMPYQVHGTVPLYRYWNSKKVDHFYTTDSNEIGTTTPGKVGNHGYVSEGIQCYVPPYY